MGVSSEMLKKRSGLLKELGVEIYISTGFAEGINYFLLRDNINSVQLWPNMLGVRPEGTERSDSV